MAGTRAPGRYPSATQKPANLVLDVRLFAEGLGGTRSNLLSTKPMHILIRLLILLKPLTFFCMFQQRLAYLVYDIACCLAGSLLINTSRYTNVMSAGRKDCLQVSILRIREG